MRGEEGREGFEWTLCLVQGLVRNIGISNFSIKKTQEVLAFCRIRPAVNQVGQHLDQELLCIHALGGCACMRDTSDAAQD